MYIWFLHALLGSWTNAHDFRLTLFQSLKIFQEFVEVPEAVSVAVALAAVSRPGTKMQVTTKGENDINRLLDIISTYQIMSVQYTKYTILNLF